MMRSFKRLRRPLGLGAQAVVLGLLAIVTADPAAADPVKCERAIAKTAAKFA
jgi:hypothetical protein